MKKLKNLLYIIILFYYFLFYFISIQSANWVQISGYQRQNIVIPYIPSPDNKHFTPRWGLVVLNANESVSETGNGNILYEERLYVLGGDDWQYNQDEYRAKGTQFKNDIWYLESPEFVSYEDATDEKMKILSDISWKSRSDGNVPPSDVTYDEWIICQDVLKDTLPDPDVCDDNPEDPPGSYLDDNMWSPRRHHQGIYYQGAIWIMGGRAREHKDIDEEEAIGGIMSPRIENDKQYSAWREKGVLKNDIWKSEDDGDSWILVNPGCKVHQEDLIIKANDNVGNNYGPESQRCSNDNDCYGFSKCKDISGNNNIKNKQGTCVCQMWSPREEFKMISTDDGIYVIGGYTSIRKSLCGEYGCGDINAGSYRQSLNDVWYSVDGTNWTSLILDAEFSPRGGHAIEVINDRIWLFGGKYEDNNEKIYYNDIWYSDLLPKPIHWTKNDSNSEWSPRSGHTINLEKPNEKKNEREPILYLIGGIDEYNNYLDDVWTWKIKNNTWDQDYSINQWYRKSTSSDNKLTTYYKDHTPHYYYITPDSPIELLGKIILPIISNRINGKKSTRKELISDDELNILHSVNIKTIRDLAEADKYKILKLRGFDFPNIPNNELIYYEDICDLRELAEDLVKKCTIDSSYVSFDGEEYMPWNLNPIFKKGAPAAQNAAWHGKDYTQIKTDLTLDEIIDEWNGCSIITEVEKPNVPGIGKVTQVDSIRDPWRESQEILCKWNPGARSYHGSTMFQNRLYLIGGKSNDKIINEDVWYRDDHIPLSSLTKKPTSKTSDTKFEFISDENDGWAKWEWRLWDKKEYKELIPWTEAVDNVNLKDILFEGNFIFYLRTIDAAGNRDNVFIEGINMHTWNYVPSPPIVLIIVLVFLFTFLLILGYIYWKSVQRRKKMQRYAMKRMRRKFKVIQKDIGESQTDWRKLYQDKKKKKKKKVI